MYLSDACILHYRELGLIEIEPFVPENLNPDSYDLTLGDKISVYLADLAQVGMGAVAFNVSQGKPAHDQLSPGADWNRYTIQHMIGHLDPATSSEHPGYTLGSLDYKQSLTAAEAARANAGLKKLREGSRPVVLDSRDKAPAAVTFDLGLDPQYFSEHGFTLWPGIGYLLHTRERCHAKAHVTTVWGKSSGGRSFLQVHRAGWAEVGFNGVWCLQATVQIPLRVYPGQKIAQLAFADSGKPRNSTYAGRYQNQTGADASKGMV